MRIIVLHGSDTKKLYDRLTAFINEAKKRGWLISDFDLNKIRNSGLFENEYLFLVRDYKELDLNELQKTKNIKGNIVIYHEGTIPASFLKELNPDKTEKLDLPIQIWSFLNKITVRSFNEIIKTEAVEYVFAMIAWKLKQNYIKSPTEQNASKIKILSEIDVKAKTGKGELVTLLDLFIQKHLQ